MHENRKVWGLHLTDAQPRQEVQPETWELTSVALKPPSPPKSSLSVEEPLRESRDGVSGQVRYMNV